MRQGGRGEASCRVIELMKNRVLKAQWFEQWWDWRLLKTSFFSTCSCLLLVAAEDVNTDLFFFLFISLKAQVEQAGCFLSWMPELCAVRWTFCLERERFWLTAGLHLTAFPQRASIQFLSLNITWVCLCRLYSSYPNTGVNCLSMKWTHTKRADQIQWDL